MKYVAPPENLPIFSETPASVPIVQKNNSTGSEPEDIHYREPEAGGTVTELPEDESRQNADHPLGACSLTTEEPPMKHENARTVSQSAFITALELAAWLGVTRYSVYSLVRKDGLPHYKYSGVLRFKRSEIEEFLKSRRMSGHPHANPKD